MRINEPRYNDLLLNLTQILKNYQTISSKSKPISANTPFINAIERMVVAALALMPLSDNKLISPAFQLAYFDKTQNLNFLDRCIFEVVGNLINNYTTSATLARLYSVTYSQSLVSSYIIKLIIEISIVMVIILLCIVLLSLFVKKLNNVIHMVILIIISLPRNIIFEYTQVLEKFHQNLSQILFKLSKNSNNEETKSREHKINRNTNKNVRKSIRTNQNNIENGNQNLTKLPTFIELFEKIKEDDEEFDETNQESNIENEAEIDELILKKNLDFQSNLPSLLTKIIPFYFSMVLSLFCCIYFLIVLIYFNSIIPATLNKYILVNNRTISFSILSIDYKAHLMNFYQYFGKNDRDPFIRFFEMFETTEHDLYALMQTNDTFFKPYFDRKLIQDSKDFCSKAVLYKWINISEQYCRTINYGKFSEGFDAGISFYAFTMERNYIQILNNKYNSAFLSNVMKSNEFTEMIDGFENIISFILLSNDVFASEIVDYTINLFWYYGLIFYMIILSIFIVTIALNFILPLILIKREILNYKTLLSIIPGKAMIVSNIKEKIQNCLLSLQ